MSAHAAAAPSTHVASAARTRRRNYARRYRLFILPAGLVVAAVIVFPWLFTLFMSLQDYHAGGVMSFVGLANYGRMLGDERLFWALVHTLYFTSLAVVLPTASSARVRRRCASTSVSRCAGWPAPSSSCP